jgi:RNA polymerase-binding transcription factor DksA
MRQLNLSDIDELEVRLMTDRLAVWAKLEGQLQRLPAPERAAMAAELAHGRVPAVLPVELDGDVLRHQGDGLAAIDLALQRIDFGTIGTCTACGWPIGAKRLRAVPTALTCDACASALEG